MRELRRGDYMNISTAFGASIGVVTTTQYFEPQELTYDGDSQWGKRSRSEDSIINDAVATAIETNTYKKFIRLVLKGISERQPGIKTSTIYKRAIKLCRN
jgi:hypothetical protein